MKTDGESNGTPLQYCCPENPMGGGVWWAAVHGAARSRKRLSDFTFTFHFPALEKEMATDSSVLGLENPRDGGVWWAAVYGVAQSQTRLKRLSSSSSSMKTEYGRSHTFTRGMGLLLGMKDKVGTEESERIFWVRMKGKEEALIQHPGSTCLGSCYQWEEIISSFLFI